MDYAGRVGESEKKDEFRARNALEHMKGERRKGAQGLIVRPLSSS